MKILQTKANIVLVMNTIVFTICFAVFYAVCAVLNW